ncbi:energy transducer TonB [uncultured Capnocytophaga sp.]|jgi:tonB family C-terminal domain|uniref:energy transducer TonB n=1 Tax=uncultured Capnocytophaga sp. TaxID=159273 RepID=UPI002626FD0F|nr:energy transducer TonB [uncultured Capnocytophaga sp.]
MKPKKNPNVDLKKRVGLFFSIGLAIATFASLYAINYKSVEEGKKKIEFDKLEDLSENVQDVVMEENTPPPPPPPEPEKKVEIPPDVLKRVDDDQKVDTDFKSTDTNKEEASNVAPPKINTTGVPGGTGTGDDDIQDDVQFFAIEQKPMFEECKNVPKEEQERCFKKALDAFVSKTLVYPETAMQMGSQGRVVVQFRIKKDGNVEVINAQGKDKILEKEARRVIEKLPRLIPGKQRERPVAVIFSYPIVFRLN